MKTSSLLLLAPSKGFGGGIERVARAIEEAWQGPVTRVDLYRPNHVPIATGRPVTKAGFALRTITAALRSRPGTVITLHVGLLPVAHAAALLTRATTVLIGHGVEVWAPMNSLRRAFVRRCDVILGVSSFTARWIADRAQIPRDRVSVLPLAVDLEFVQAQEEPASIPNATGHSFITISRIESTARYKGLFDVARALPSVLARVPKARWIVVGAGDDLDPLRAECARLNVAHAVEFRGSVTDAELIAIYREASFLALPSVADPEAEPPVGEGFGLVYLEAAQFGLPSIASSAGGGALDFVENNITGLTVPPGDSQSLTNAIVRLLNDGERRSRLGALARERVAARHLPVHFGAALCRALRASKAAPAESGTAKRSR